MLTPVRGASWPRNGPGAFGYRRSSTHVHQGVDFAAKRGEPVWSVAPGVVTHSVEPGTPGFSGYGRAVVVRTGNRWRLYGHLDRRSVAAGDNVVEGMQLGTVGATCGTRDQPQLQCRGAHLHYELSARPYPQASEAPRLNPKEGDVMAQSDQERLVEAWSNLNQLIEELWEAVPPEARNVPQFRDEVQRWRDDYARHENFLGFSFEPLANWVEIYNSVRSKAKAAGVAVPPKARLAPSLLERFASGVNENIVKPASFGAGAAVVLLALAFLWDRRK